MNRATIFQLAVGVVLIGLFLLLAGSVPSPSPKPTQTWRPATELEQRQRDREILMEEMDRLWEQRATR